jgi:hypothetical protein
MKSPKYGTPTHAEFPWAGVIKPERTSTSKHRMTKAKHLFAGANGARSGSRFKKKNPITLPTQPFDWRS